MNTNQGGGQEYGSTGENAYNEAGNGAIMVLSGHRILEMGESCVQTVFPWNSEVLRTDRAVSEAAASFTQRLGSTAETAPTKSSPCSSQRTLPGWALPQPSKHAASGCHCSTTSGDGTLHSSCLL